MSELDPPVRALAEAYGIATDFWDWRGQHTVVPQDTVTAVLAALDVPAGSAEEAEHSLAALRRAHWSRMLPTFLVGRLGESVTCWVHVTHGDPVDIRVDLEDGGHRSDVVQLENWTPPEDLDGRAVGEASFALPADLPLGYHSVHVWSGGREAVAPVVITPAFLGFPARTGDRRTWGLATQLYSVRSEQSWGVGDLTDLTDLAVWSGSRHGAGYVLVNPLHAAEPTAPMEPSPYLPTTRRFANPLYLRVERIPEFADLPAADREAVATLRADLHALVDDLDQIDRNAAWTSKAAALRIVHAAGRTAGREIAYQAFQHREGPGLQDFALWCALATVHGPDWSQWPEGLRHPHSPEVTTFAAGHGDEVDFHRWLQWCLDEQLSAAQTAATDAGMALGIVHDLAVGVHPRGADAWSLQDSYARGVSVGAPPDAFNQAGQDWAQPPWRPDRLAELGYAPFRDLVATVLRHAGGVRVDHIIGLFRLWWVPAGHLPTQGTYVRYDHQAMIGILALEAQRAGALVVGEDLGTVEPWVRDFLSERGILGTSILWFEFEYGAGPDGGDRPLRPEWWREYCLASVTTHDLPPTAGYLVGEHVRLRHRLGLLTRTLEEELAADSAEREAWLSELRERGAIPADGEVSVEDLVVGLHRYLTWTPSRLLCVSLTDAVGDPRTQNQPGTIDEYPNWRVPLSGPDGESIRLEDVLTSRRAARLFEVVRD